MDPKRKRLYIILIAICVILSIGILLWSHLQNPSATAPAATSTTGSVSTLPTKKVTPGTPPTFTPPAVFPQNTKLDSATLDLSSFKALQFYQPLAPSSTDFGKDDLFK